MVSHLVYININLFPMFHYIVFYIIYIYVYIPLDNELNLHTVHHIDIWGHL
jgi:hypothetical protein